jgi:DNA-binding MarR family transcriptional regulator
MGRNRSSKDRVPDVGDLPCACATARRVARVLTQIYDAHLHPTGIESTQFALLSLVASAGSSTQAAIGQRFGYDKTTLSRNLKLLRDRGWIELTAARSGRERPYSVTAAGLDRLRRARPAWRRAQASIRETMGGDDWQAMWTAFGRITAAAQVVRAAAATRRSTLGVR